MNPTRPTSADSVFQSHRAGASKLFGFKGLVSCFRSILQSSDKDPNVRPAHPSEHSPAELGRAVSEPGLTREKDPFGPRVDALELLLAAAAPPMRASTPDGPLLDAAGKLVPSGASIEPVLIEQVVQRLVIGGDRRRGVARIDLDGDYAGTIVWVRGEGRAVELEVVLGPGLSEDSLPERLLGCLRARGLDVCSVEVR